MKLKKITKITSREYKGKVYNINVDDTHTYTINDVFEKVSHSIISYELLDNKIQLVFDFELVDLSDIVNLTKEDITWFHLFLKDKLGNNLGKLNVTVKDPMFEILR